MRNATKVIAGALLLGSTAGCGGRGDIPEGPAPIGTTARAELITRDRQRIGTATFTQMENGVQIAIQASRLSSGRHGFHIHETGRCDAPGFQSAGGHLNPTSRNHGLEDPGGPHAGDLPNMIIRPDGAGSHTVLNPYVTLGGGPNSLFKRDGTAIVIHAAPDDYQTDPSGNSGDRVACGVIRRG